MDTHTHLSDVEDWKEICKDTSSETTKYRNLTWDVGSPGGSVIRDSACQRRRHRFDPWSGKFPLPSCGTTKPVHHSCWASALEPGNCNF